MKNKKQVMHGGYELGKTYFNAYWRQECTVLQLHGEGTWGDWSVTVKWGDGRITKHCTPRDKRDREIVSV